MDDLLNTTPAPIDSKDSVETAVRELFMQIFNVEKVTFRMPSFQEQGGQGPGVQEQGCLFVDMTMGYPSNVDGKFKMKITGDAMMVAQYQNLPMGFFAKAISEADNKLTKDLFFMNFESNKQRFGDLVQRGFSFVYLFSVQFNPPSATISEIDINIEET